MITVIFEVWPNPDTQQEYLDTATELRSLLETMDGFISIERFQSLTEPGKLLSLSFWRDEASVAEWRRLEAHRAAQAQGRSSIFNNYRLRVASVIRDYGLNEREEAPRDSRTHHG